MAEIKSTMELVMQRAARMAANATSETSDEDKEKGGMRLAAEFLDGKLPDLMVKLAEQSPADQLPITRGAARILLRNIVLPRDEILEQRNGEALRGITELIQSAGAAPLTQVCDQLRQILQQYGKHKEQVVQQLEDALKEQVAQQLAGRGMDTSRVTATMHPKYREEMSRLEQDLNNQYTQALEQRKQMILQQLGLE